MSFVRCDYCGSFHAGICSRVKAFEYFQCGAVKRVEFHEPQPIVSIEAGKMGEPVPALKLRSVE